MLGTSSRAVRDCHVTATTRIVSCDIGSRATSFFTASVACDHARAHFGLIIGKRHCPIMAGLIKLCGISGALTTLTTICTLNVPLRSTAGTIASLTNIVNELRVIPNTGSVNICISFTRSPSTVRGMLNIIHRFARKEIVSIFNNTKRQRRRGHPVVTHVNARLSSCIVLAASSAKGRPRRRVVTVVLTNVRGSGCRCVRGHGRTVRRTVTVTRPKSAIVLLKHKRRTSCGSENAVVHLLSDRITTRTVRLHGRRGI